MQGLRWLVAGLYPRNPGSLPGQSVSFHVDKRDWDKFFSSTSVFQRQYMLLRLHIHSNTYYRRYITFVIEKLLNNTGLQVKRSRYFQLRSFNPRRNRSIRWLGRKDRLDVTVKTEIPDDPGGGNRNPTSLSSCA